MILGYNFTIINISKYNFFRFVLSRPGSLDLEFTGVMYFLLSVENIKRDILTLLDLGFRIRIINVRKKYFNPDFDSQLTNHKGSISIQSSFDNN